MAKRYDNDKGFLVIEMSYEEARDICGFGITYVSEDTGLIYDHKLLCDTCNNSITDNVYYVAAINRVLCKECCDDIIANQKRYKEDIPYEKRHYNYYAEGFNLELE